MFTSGVTSCSGVRAYVAPLSVTCILPFGSVCTTSASLVSPLLFVYVTVSPLSYVGATGAVVSTSTSAGASSTFISTVLGCSGGGSLVYSVSILVLSDSGFCL